MNILNANENFRDNFHFGGNKEGHQIKYHLFIRIFVLKNHTGYNR